MYRLIKIVLGAGLVTSALSASAQELIVVDGQNIPENKEVEKELIYTVLERMPVFPGNVSLMEFINKKIKYPLPAVDNGIEGTVVVQFTVAKTGWVRDVIVVQSVDFDLDREARRVILSLPKFYPGEINGKLVATMLTVPVTFKLPE